MRIVTYQFKNSAFTDNDSQSSSSAPKDSSSNTTFDLLIDKHMVDGLGGEIWQGAICMSSFLEDNLLSNYHSWLQRGYEINKPVEDDDENNKDYNDDDCYGIEECQNDSEIYEHNKPCQISHNNKNFKILEFGAGTGLCGLVCASIFDQYFQNKMKMETRIKQKNYGKVLIYLTDEYIDLITENSLFYKQQQINKIQETTLYSSASSVSAKSKEKESKDDEQKVEEKEKETTQKKKMLNMQGYEILPLTLKWGLQCRSHLVQEIKKKRKSKEIVKSTTPLLLPAYDVFIGSEVTPMRVGHEALLDTFYSLSTPYSTIGYFTIDLCPTWMKDQTFKTTVDSTTNTISSSSSSTTTTESSPSYHQIQKCLDPNRCSHHHFVNLAYTKYKLKSEIVRVYDTTEIQNLRAIHIIQGEKSHHVGADDHRDEESDWGDVLVAPIGILKLYY